MRHTFAFIAAVCCFTAFSSDWLSAQQVRPVSAGAPSKSVEEVLAAVRADLQATRADVMAKSLSLTAAQAAKFWPVYEAYQKEQNAIMDEQLKGVQRYVQNYETLDDAGALGLIQAHLDRDSKMVGLRQKWLGEFQKVIGTKLAVRAMQIDRRLSMVYQLDMVTQIPLSH